MVLLETKSADLTSLLQDPERKRRYVRALFDRVAPAYDRFTRWFSYGMDGAWKRELAAALASRIPSGATVIDLACGTGDLGRALRSVRADVRILGTDLSAGMLHHARRRDSSAVLAVADMTSLPLPDGAADAVLAGYAFRNAPDPRVAVRESARILKAGGWLASLDFYLPEASIWRTLFLAYLKAAGSIYGWCWHRNPACYAYIASSLELFVTAAQFASLLREHGFEYCEVRRKLEGGIAIHLARRAV
ncbi:Demethylmenaquinone methyltransferase [bacterium HR33]|nr:Demethylmenaquinone methyltransferase [bacterium HR33]